MSKVYRANVLSITGEHTEAILNKMKGKPFKHPLCNSLHDVHFDPNKIILEPAAADDNWRVQHWGCQEVFLYHQKMTRLTADKVRIYFETFLSAPILLILKLSKLWGTTHVFEMASCLDDDYGTNEPSVTTTFTFLNGNLEKMEGGEIEKIKGADNDYVQHICAMVTGAGFAFGSNFTFIAGNVEKFSFINGNLEKMEREETSE